MNEIHFGITGEAVREGNFHTIVELFRYRAERQSQRYGFKFLTDGENEGATLTYGELDRRSRAIAVMLQRSFPPGTRVLLMYPPGLDFISAFIGCLYAGVIGVPAHPPHPARPTRTMPRLKAIARDAEIGAILGPESILEMAPRIMTDIPELKGVECVITDRPDLEAANEWREPEIGPETIAFLQYTSGSTAVPKGVMVSHRNLIHNLSYIHQVQQDGPDSCSLSWLPAQHDMGLIGGILQPAFIGYSAYLMAPGAFLQRPFRWLQAISRYRVTNSGGPNFAYDLCVQKITPFERRGLDLSCWKIAYNGSEPIRKDTIEIFNKMFSECGFKPESHRPVYGLAEATLLVSMGQASNFPFTRRIAEDSSVPDDGPVAGKPGGDGCTLVGCGTPRYGTKVIIANPEDLTQRVAGEVGEIWIASPSVAQGYWNNPEETGKTFSARLADTGDGPFLRTGDLGLIWDNELYITGRIKDLIIIRGRKLYPQDIELTMERSHSAIRSGGCAAFFVTDSHRERLVVAAEVDRRSVGIPESDEAIANLQVVIANLRQAIAELHEVQVHAVMLLARGGIPKTSSGKLQRHACRAGFLEGTLPVVAQWTQAPPLFGGTKINNKVV